MTFKYDGKVRLVKKNLVNSNGKELKFVTIANTTTFENCDFMIGRDVNFEQLKEGKDYDAYVDIQGRYSSLILY